MEYSSASSVAEPEDVIGDVFILEEEDIGEVRVTEITGKGGITYYELQVAPLSEQPNAFFVVLTRQSIDLLRGALQVMLDKNPEGKVH